ncbi:MAG TPA: hemerythrin domain-containing protein [Desulfitobacteriaceae bacterium]|nr:hemerythrin domain-containing protein [Desulfitobacteriaceae bacterium]
MSNSSKPNIGATMIHVHHAITRGLEVSNKQILTFIQAGYPNTAIREGFATYVRTLGMVINAHHSAEDNVIYPYLRSRLPDAPYDQLSSEHKEMDVFLRELRESVEAFAVQAQDKVTLNNLNRIITDLTNLWLPHIAKEQLYLYDSAITEAVMNEEEQIKLIGDATKHSLEQGNPALIVPFVLYNLPPEERAAMSALMPPELIQEMIPKVWKPQWSPMQPFLLE